MPFLVILCVLTAGAAQIDPSRDELLQEFAERLSDATSQEQVFHANGFSIESSHSKEIGRDLKPNGNEFDLLHVRAVDTFSIGIEKGRPMSAGGGLAIFHRASGAPILAVGDANGDGALDGLTYSTADANGKILLSVTDYEADGQADLRINFADSYVEFWYKDKWYRMETRDERRGIVVGESFIELRRENNRYVAP
jgi:hypothetical protein